MLSLWLVFPLFIQLNFRSSRKSLCGTRQQSVTCGKRISRVWRWASSFRCTSDVDKGEKINCWRFYDRLKKRSKCVNYLIWNCVNKFCWEKLIWAKRWRQFKHQLCNRWKQIETTFYCWSKDHWHPHNKQWLRIQLFTAGTSCAPKAKKSPWKRAKIADKKRKLSKF